MKSRAGVSLLCPSPRHAMCAAPEGLAARLTAPEEKGTGTMPRPTQAGRTGLGASTGPVASKGGSGPSATPC